MTITLEELCSFYNAVEDRRSPPDTSASDETIQDLEKIWEIRILDEKNPPYGLTPEGEKIYRQTRNIFYQTQELFHSVSQGGLPKEKEIRLSVDILFPLGKLKSIFDSFSSQYPDFPLKIHIENRGRCIEQLLKKETDLAITPSPQFPKGIEFSLQDTVDFVPLVSPEHPLIQENPLLSQEELARHVHILVKNTKGASGFLNEFLSDQKRQTWYVENFLLKRELLLAGLGWGFMPSSLIGPFREKELLVPLNLEKSTWENFFSLYIDDLDIPLEKEMKLYLIRRKTAQQGPGVTFLWEKIRGESFLSGFRGNNP